MFAGNGADEQHKTDKKHYSQMNCIYKYIYQHKIVG